MSLSEVAQWSILKSGLCSIVCTFINNVNFKDFSSSLYAWDYCDLTAAAAIFRGQSHLLPLLQTFVAALLLSMLALTTIQHIDVVITVGPLLWDSWVSANDSYARGNPNCSRNPEA